MRETFGIRLVKRLARWQYFADLRLHRALGRLRSGRPWKLVGECRRCGACCEAPAIEVSLLVYAVPVLRRFFLAWQRRVNGFELVRADDEARAFVFRCSHFDHASRSCGCYDSRPAVCRDYPRNLLSCANPKLLPTCGYRALPPNAAGLLAAIETLELTPEMREKLRKGLRLE